MDKLFLLDAYALIYRAYYAFIKNPRINSKGMNTSAVMGFVNTLNEILTKEQPTHIGVAFDHGKTFRDEAFPAYKAQREATPEDIRASVPIIKDIITAMHIPVLQVDGKENLYVWEKKPGILHEDEAAALLYKAAAGKNIHGTEPKEGKIELIADCDGLLKINREALLAVNRTPQMMIATIHGDLPVKKGQKLAGTRIIPLVIEQEKMDAMQAAAGSEPILNVLPMQAKKFAVITTGSEVFKGRIEDKFTPILVGKLAEYGCEMTFHKVCDDDPAGITAAILEAKAAGCELIFTTGGMSVDPDDRTPLAIRNTGADIVTYGAPVLPGAMFLVSYLDGVPVCGLPGCVMYAKRTIFDLLLPRLLADDAITAEDIARLGEGGLCLGCAECHWPNCGFGHC